MTYPLASPAFRHAPGCTATVSAPLCDCRRAELRARLAQSVKLLDGDRKVVPLIRKVSSL